MRYLGNKTRMINNIEKFMADNNIQGEVFCDLFAGSASVCDYFKERYSIIANDLLYSSYIITNAKINNNSIPRFNNFVSKYGESPFSYFSKKEYAYDNRHFIWMNYSPKGNRQFFTEEIANKIDGIRLDLETFYSNGLFDKNEYFFLLASLLESAMGVSNTSGTYEAFLKEWDRRSFKKFVLTPLELCVTNHVNKNLVFNQDANSLIKVIEGDILYLDTPYTITDYNSAYHLLETIAKYDYPEIKGITGRRANKKEKSLYSIKEKVAIAYEQLISDARFEHIVISYSTQSLLPVEDLLSILKKYSSIPPVINYYPFREYKNIRSSQKGANLREVLIYIKKELRG